MSRDVVVITETTTTLRERYDAIQAALNKQLLKWHPDVTSDPRAARMTRKILATKAQAERLYEMIRKGRDR